MASNQSLVCCPLSGQNGILLKVTNLLQFTWLLKRLVSTVAWLGVGVVVQSSPTDIAVT